MNLDLSKIKKIFFIGIGGIGISALAKMAVSRGIQAFGINDEDSPQTLDPLREIGIDIVYQEGLSAGALEEADMYVYSDAWIYRGPEILAEARATSKPVLSYFEALGAFAKEYKVIAIAGVHGKTTTTAMVAEILIDAGLDPTVIVGSFVKKFGNNFRAGKSEWLVVEADEYMRHFLNFNPYITVITNIEADHLDYYADLADVQHAFKELESQTDHTITDYSKYIPLVPDLLVPGAHNRANSAAALAVADFLKVPIPSAQKSLASFAGTWRRLEKRGVTSVGTIIYDDYAHHPTEIRASIQALRELYPKEKGKKITIVFQPHLYSRTKAFFGEFAQSFVGADQILFLPIYFAREFPDPTISSDKLAEAVISFGQTARSFPDFESGEAFVRRLQMGPDDIFVTMGAGEAYKVADQAFKFV